MFPFQRPLKDSTQPQQVPHPGKYREIYRGEHTFQGLTFLFTRTTRTFTQ